MTDSNAPAPLLVRRLGEGWSTPAVTSYTKEAHLQEVLAQQPSLLPGVGPSPVAVREMQTGAGPLDVVVLDSNGRVSLVECKLGTNAQIRREIIGQVLDYASSIWRMSFSDFDARWRQRRAGGEGLIESLGAEDEEAATLSSAVASNLAAGRFNVVLAVDEINDPLRRIVEFLNDRTAPDLSIVAIELRYAKHGDVEMLVPTVYGAELARAKAEKSATAESWSENDVHDYLKQHWPEAAPIVTEILDAFRQLPGVQCFGTRATTPSMIARWEGPDGTSWPFVVYTSKKPHIRINFHWMTAVPDATKLELAKALAELPGSTVDADQTVAKQFKNRPAFGVQDALNEPAVRAGFIAALKGMLTSTD